MRSTASLLFLALASTIAIVQADYEIKLYSHSWCLIKNGKKCSGLLPGECCYDGGNKYKSGKISSGSGKDYSLSFFENPCTNLAIATKDGSSCLTASDQTVLGAMVSEGNEDKRKRDEPIKLVEPDEAFLEEGNYIYTIKRNSTMGEAYEKLTRSEDQVEHLRTFGKRELLSPDETVFWSTAELHYTLNIKSVPYHTEWVELPDIKSTRIRIAHDVAPVRKLPDDSDFYTLPMIHDTATGCYMGDSFDIAVYLDQKYSDNVPRLFPPGSIGIHRAFNARVDALFSRHVILVAPGLPFNPETAEVSKSESVRRANASCWEDFIVKGDARLKLVETFKAEMEDFAKLYRFDNGPFLEGNTIFYADIIVGGWLASLKVSLPEWDQLCEWQGERWKRLHEALNQWAEVK